MLDNISPTIADAPLDCPTNNSPTIYSAVVVDALKIEDNTSLGADASVVSDDSNIPCISIISGVFNEIKLSSTLVPKG